MEKAYKYRIYPNKRQKELLARTFGCCRFVYNHFLNRRIATYQKEQKTMTYNQCSSELTELKSQLTWLKEPDKCSLQNTIKDMDKAYKNFFKNNAGFPKYKSKKTHRFFTILQVSIPMQPEPPVPEQQYDLPEIQIHESERLHWKQYQYKPVRQVFRFHRHPGLRSLLH